MIILKRFLRNQKGQTLVELALVLPVLCLLVLGIVEFGRVFHTHLVLSNASREGARAAAIGQGDLEVRATVTAAAPTLNNGTLSITVEPVQGERVRGEKVTVRASYNLPLVAPFMSVVLPDPFPVRAATAMRVE